MKIKMIKDGCQDNNYLGFDEIILIGRRLHKRVDCDAIVWGDKVLKGSFHEYEYEAICDGFFMMISEDDVTDCYGYKVISVEGESWAT